MSKPVTKPKPSIKKKPSNIKVFTANWAYTAQVCNIPYVTYGMLEIVVQGRRPNSEYLGRR